MGLTTSHHTKKIYLSIVDGKIAQKVNEGTTGAVSRKNKNDQVTHELLHEAVSGKIKEMKVETKVFGDGKKSKQLEITMQDVDESFILTLPVESKFFDHFCSKIGSADLSKTLEIKPYSFIPKGESKKKSGLNLYQNGEKLAYFFSPEKPMGKPFPPVEKLDEDAYKVFKINERKFYCDYVSGIKITQAPEKQESNTDQLPF